jgi:hypothetical protein
MQLDFHYYAVFKLAALAGYGYRDAETISYASQYVDDSTEGEPIKPFPDQHFDTVRTAHYNLGAFDWNIQKKIYIPFHFIPANIRWQSPAGFTYVTRAHSHNPHELSTMLVHESLNETNPLLKLIRLGMTLHTIADSFAHFGFSGRHHEENNVGRIWLAKKDGRFKLDFLRSYVGDLFVPKIGHVEAFEYPDQPFLKWRYTNSRGRRKTRDNLATTLEAARQIYRILRHTRSSSTQTPDLEPDYPNDYREMKALFQRRGDLDSRCQRWRDFTHAPKYDKTKWRRAALEGDVKWDDMSRSERQAHTRTLRGKKGFDQSRWAYFHRAALKQRSLVLGWMN